MFNSGYFVPYIISNNETLVHVPSLGKALSKALVYKMKPNLMPLTWLSEVTRQREAIWAHIPVLRQIAPACRKHIADCVKAGIDIKPLPDNEDVRISGSYLAREDPKLRNLEPSQLTITTLEIIYDLPTGALMQTDANLKVRFSSNWIGTVIDNPDVINLIEKDLS
jgi:hypothetical protein